MRSWPRSTTSSRAAPESYVEQNGAALEQGGFFETEIGRVTERFGLIAHAFSAYESKRSVSDAEPFARGINSFQLMSDGDRCREPPTQFPIGISARWSRTSAALIPASVSASN